MQPDTCDRWFGGPAKKGRGQDFGFDPQNLAGLDSRAWAQGFGFSGLGFGCLVSGFFVGFFVVF